MAVRARINGRDFLLSWEEFEKAFYGPLKHIEILDMWKKESNC